VFKPGPVDSPMSYLCYSGAIFTSLGLDDTCFEGHIRFVTVMEALNGFLLITWSASSHFLQWGGSGNGIIVCNKPMNKNKPIRKFCVKGK